jgi:hypothetical protein
MGRRLQPCQSEFRRQQCVPRVLSGLGVSGGILDGVRHGVQHQGGGGHGHEMEHLAAGRERNRMLPDVS